MTKAKEFMKSEEVKSMKARATDGDEQMFLHYDIAIGAALSLWHILSLIFYCDFTKLCTDFSSSFRAIKPFETLRNIKKRNAMYYCCYSLLSVESPKFGARLLFRLSFVISKLSVKNQRKYECNLPIFL